LSIYRSYKISNWRSYLRAGARLVVAFSVGAIGILSMLLLADLRHISWGIVPFATSIAMVAGAPESLPASTKSIFLGHLLCAIVGFMALYIFGHGHWVGAIAVGLSVAVMLACRVFHPPAAISSLLIPEIQPDISFLIVPVIFGAILVVILARTSELIQRRLSSSSL
jgi:CBS-domain-containing membrane protein